MLLGYTYTPSVQNRATVPTPAKMDAPSAVPSSGRGLRDLGSLRDQLSTLHLACNVWAVSEENLMRTQIMQVGLAETHVVNRKESEKKASRKKKAM